MRKTIAVAAALLALTGCALYSDVDITPLQILPSNIDRGIDLPSMVRKADFLRAMEEAATVDGAQRKSATNLAALGEAYLAAGRFNDARKRLRAALDVERQRDAYAQIAWNLSQVEYMANNFEAALDWARIARDHDLIIRSWHFDYLQALQQTRAYEFSGETSARVPFRFGRPDVPRVGVKLNGVHDVDAIIDSGAVLSILSERLASTLRVRSLGPFEGTFLGLLGEPIPVRFGMLDKVQLGGIDIANVPVAIMPDEKMRFLLSKRDGREFHMDFLLGSNLLKEFRLELNFDRHRATFKVLTAADRQPVADQNLFFYNFRPYVRGAVNGKAWYLFVLDTGSEITFLNEARLRTVPIQTNFGAHNAMLQGLGGTMKRGAKIENIEVGIARWGGKFKTLPMYASADKEYALGIIGQNFLKHFNVVIDFGKMTVELQRR